MPVFTVGVVVDETGVVVPVVFVVVERPVVEPFPVGVEGVVVGLPCGSVLGRTDSWAITLPLSRMFPFPDGSAVQPSGKIKGLPLASKIPDCDTSTGVVTPL